MKNGEGFVFVASKASDMDVPVQIIMTPREFMNVVRNAFMAGHSRNETYEQYVDSRLAEGVTTDDLRE